MPKLIVTVGCSGSGKTIWANYLGDGWMNINRDDWRFRLFTNNVKDWSLYKFTKARESQVTQMCDNDFDVAVVLGLHIVVSNTNLNQKDIDYWKNKAEKAGYEFEIKYFDFDLEELLKRDTKRGALSVGREVILKQYQKWLELTNARVYVPNTSLPKTVVSDVDGTVAKMVGRSPYDWSKVGQDEPREDIIRLVTNYAHNYASKLVFVSGRDGSCYDETYKWLHRHISQPFELYMRAAGDQRKDTTIKEDIIFNKLEPKYNIVMWFDDRASVIRKLKCLKIPNIINVDTELGEF